MCVILVKPDSTNIPVHNEIEFLTKVLATQKRLTKNLSGKFKNIPSRQQHFGLLTWLFRLESLY